VSSEHLKLWQEYHNSKLLTSSSRNNRSNLLRPKQSNLIRKRSRSKSTLGGRVDRATEVNVIDNSVASLLGVGEEDGALNRVGKGRALDKNLGAHAGVDTREQNAVPVVVDDVHGGEADKGLAAADVLPVVVGIGDVKLALVFGSVVVRVADQRALPLHNLLVTIANN
jgi:hypothetical protein